MKSRSSASATPRNHMRSAPRGGTGEPCSFLSCSSFFCCDAAAQQKKEEQERKEQGSPVPPRGAERMWFRGVALAEDRDFIRYQMRHLIGREGLGGADE